MRSGADAVSVYEDPLLVVAHAARLAALADTAPASQSWASEYADGRVDSSLRCRLPDVWRRGAGFADRIFKGAKPSDYPDAKQPLRVERHRGQPEDSDGSFI
jgi:hypothetical protein